MAVIQYNTIQWNICEWPEVFWYSKDPLTINIYRLPMADRVSRVRGSLHVRKPGCAGGRGFAPRPGQ